MYRNSNTSVGNSNNSSPNKLSVIFIIVCILIIIVLVVLLLRCNKGQEKFCACRNMADKRCPNTHNLTNLYNSGKLTEFSNFAKAEKQNPFWKMVMPDDIFDQQMNQYYKEHPQKGSCKKI